MIHWDWVLTLWLITIPASAAATMFSAIVEPLKTERMKAEAALLEQKRYARKEGMHVA